MTSTSTPSRASELDDFGTAGGSFSPPPAAPPRPSDEDLLNQARSRAAAPPDRSDRWTTNGLVVAFVAAVGVMAATLPWAGSTSPVLIAALVLAHALLSRVEFEVGPGSAVPTQLVLVPMLLLLPAPLVPLSVAAGYVVGALPQLARRRLHSERSLVLVASSWHAVGPALVIALFAGPSRGLEDWPIFAAALAAQLVFDFASSAGREWIAFGTRPQALLPVLVWVYTVDVLLAPVGLLAALLEPYAFALTLPLGLLLLLLARERQERLDRAIDLSLAYAAASDEARRDALTGLGNRLAWETALATVRGRSAAVLVLDVDGLKEANDTRGHAFGDELLRSVAAVVADSVRERDVLARIGGDEFAVLMPEADSRACRDAERRIAGALAAHPGIDGVRLRASIGSATSPPAGTLAEAHRLADERMYEMKPRRASTRSTVAV